MAAAASPPRAIEGSVGSRVRVILGATGSDYLILLDEDDGDRKWQTHDWKGIPSALAKQVNNCTAKGRDVKKVDFCSVTCAWYVNGIKRDGSGEHSWWDTHNGAANATIKGQQGDIQVSLGSDFSSNGNCVVIKGRNGYEGFGGVATDLLTRINRLNKRNKAIRFVRLFHNQAYFILDDEGSEWKAVGEHFSKELKKAGTVNDVAVAGDGSWIVIRPDSYVASRGVGSTLTKTLTSFYARQNQRIVNRRRQIQSYHQERERVQREAQEAREREERELAERAAREILEAQERERDEQEQRDRELAERLAKEEAARKAEEVARKAEVSASLAHAFEEHIKKEAKFIEEQQQMLRKRQRSLKASIDKLPPTQRARMVDEVVLADASDQAGDCVVCHSAPASRAVIPCGHQCLCDDCAVTLSNLSESSRRLCPLCRTSLQSTLKIYGMR